MYKYISNSRHLARKYAWIFVHRHYLFQEANSFPRAKLEKNCELRGTDNVQGQISKHIFTPNGGYCLNYPSNLFAASAVLKIGNILRYSQFQLGNIQSHKFRPIACKQKDLMDYKWSYLSTLTVTRTDNKNIPSWKSLPVTVTVVVLLII